MCSANANSGFKRLIERSFFITALIYIFFFPFFILRWYFRFMRKKFFKFIMLNALIILAVIIYLIVCFVSMPDVKSIYNYKPFLTSKFYDVNNDLIYEFGSEKRTYINIDQIPKMLIYAFIAAEDKTFYKNSGFDLNGLTRTILQDVVRFFRKQRLAGASTITQQVVKNILLSNERTLTRKVKELILSYRLSKTLTKDAIMEIYLNHVYLGMQTHGIVSASKEYFDKSVSQLTISEMALLAAMPKAPSAINPFKNYNRAVARRNWVLLRMMEDGYITQDQYEQYSKEELIVKKSHNTFFPFYAPSFFARSLLTQKMTGLTQQNLLQNGYEVQLTIDGELQKLAQNALNNSLEDYSKKHGYTGPIFSFTEDDIKNKTTNELLKSVDEPENLNNFMLAIVYDVQKEQATIKLRDNSTGIILLNDLQWAKQKISETEVNKKDITKCDDVLNVGDVIVVSKKATDSNYYSLEQLPQINGGFIAMNPKTGAILAMVGGYADLPGTFNRTIQAFRQVGSTIKPIVYGTALENGFSPTSIFMDTDILINIGDGVIWNPSNDNRKTHGPTTLRVGLEKSRNTITVRIADAIGIKKIRKKIIKSGINSNPENNLSIAIGSVESSLINMATAFSAFANNGKIQKPYLISYVKDIAKTNNNNQNQNNNSEHIFNKIYFNNCDINAHCDIFLEKTDINNEAYNIKDNNSYVNNDNKDISVNKSKTNDSGDTLTDFTKNTNNLDENKHDDLNTNEQKNGKQKEDIQDDCELFSPEVSYQIISMLQGAVKNGTSRKLNGLNMPIASKTGTSNDGKDMWNVVIAPNLVLVAYVGYDIPIRTDNFGSQYALPINREILANLPEKYKINDFQTPENIKFIKINRLTGNLATDEDEPENTIFEAFKPEDDLPKQSSENSDDIETIDMD